MNRMLFTALGGVVSILTLLIGAWAQGVNSRLEQMDARVSVLEQHYSAISQKMQDIQDGVVGIDFIVREELKWNKDHARKGK